MNLGKSFYQFLWHQPWLNINYKKSIYKKLCAYGIIYNYPFEKEFFGLKYRGNLNNNIEFNIFYFGAFEKPLLFFWLTLFVVSILSTEIPQHNPVVFAILEQI